MSQTMSREIPLVKRESALLFIDVQNYHRVENPTVSKALPFHRGISQES